MNDMWDVLNPSGVAWSDGEVGGLPAQGVVTALGSAGAGKTCLALVVTLSALARGRTCFLTSESPEAVIETSRTILDLDLQPSIADGTLTLVSFAPFFANKLKSLHSVDAPLTELGQLLAQHQIEHVVFDTIDPLLTWIDPATTAADVRKIMGQMRSWGVSVLCTTSGTNPACGEFARTATGSLELTGGNIRVDRAGGWDGAEAPLELVQHRRLRRSRTNRARLRCKAALRSAQRDEVDPGRLEDADGTLSDATCAAAGAAAAAAEVTVERHVGPRRRGG
jgi:KaiC/GvpD/RAD55 family RecA-like ATPase